MSNLFELTARPDESLFHTRHDANDPRMGEVVFREPDAYSNADIVIVGCPQDEGVRRVGGRVGAAEAPTAIREQFYRLTPFNLKKRVFDLGDLNLGASLETTHDALTS